MSKLSDTVSTADGQPYKSYTLDHHGLVAAMVDELGLVEKINAMIPQDLAQRHVSLGVAVKAMILIGLGFSQRALYLTPHFFQGKPVERLLGAGLRAEQFNDDMLGRALDSIFTFGPEPFYYLLASAVVKQLGLEGGGGHLDATSFHVDGDYNSADATAAEGVIHVRQGYSRDHRPDLNQIVLQLVTENQAGVPLMMATTSGNTNDQQGFRDFLKAYVEQLKTGGLRYLVADCALYSEQTLAQLATMAWVSRVPETFASARGMIDILADELRAEGKQSTYRCLGIVEAGVAQRWLVVYSDAARHRAKSTLQRQHLKQGETELKAFERLCRQSFACAADAQAALQAFTQKLKLTLVCDEQILQLPSCQKRGQPAQADRYAIEGQLASRINIHRQQLRRKSCFIIATNDTNGTVLSDEQVLQAYQKDQQRVERGFRFLKDPQFMASTLFLKSPARLMALMAIMTLCLMVYAALEHRIQKGLAQQTKTFPNQKGKPTERPTARWVFQFFTNISILLVNSLTQLVLNLNAHHLAILNILGAGYVSIYSNST